MANLLTYDPLNKIIVNYSVAMLINHIYTNHMVYVFKIRN